MVALFGTNDKTALTVFVVAVVLLVGAGVGLLARRWHGGGDRGDPRYRRRGPAGLAAPRRKLDDDGAGVGRRPGRARDPRPRRAAWRAARAAGGAGSSSARRSFLVRAGVLGALAVVGGGLGRRMLEGRAQQATTAAIAIPGAVDPVAAPGPDASFAIDGLTPVVVPNADFYRIDTALITPAVDLDSWTLRVFGMVDNEVKLTFSDLVELPLIERYVTIACVSNEVGGNLVGNAKWTGVRLSDVLDMAGVQPGATQIVPRSVDGWTAGFPTAWLTDPAHPRDALIAVRMNDEPLPRRARLPRPADRPRAVRLRVRDQVAGRARAHDARGVRRLLGPARLGEGGADPDPVPDRRAAVERHGQGGDRECGGRGLGAGSRDLEGRGLGRSTATGRRPRSRRRSGRRPGCSGSCPGRPCPGIT